jgi:hypothetical protein
MASCRSFLHQRGGTRRDLVTKAGVLAHPGFFRLPEESYLVVSLLTPHAKVCEASTAFCGISAR